MECTLEQRCLFFSVWRFADIILMLWLTDTEVPVQSAKTLKAFIETAVQMCSELLISRQYEVK